MSTSPRDRWERLAALRPAPKRAPAEPQPLRESVHAPSDLEQLFGATIIRNRFGEHLSIRQWLSSPEEFQCDEGALRFLFPAGAEPGAAVRRLVVDPAQWLFLDTETTGLAGGTGTYAFLVGLAWWDAGGLQVEQLFMRDHAEEHSLLLELSRRMAERRVLVTFNGKSFDWPLLETRFRMTRLIAPAAPAAHLDFLHPARQIWRLRLGSVRLTELERRVLQPDGIVWSRADDIDSSLIPQMYFDFLRGGPAEPLTGVLRHNQMDLRGLAALAGKVLRILARPESLDGAGDDAVDLYGASRLFHRRGETLRARSLCEQALAAGLPRPVERIARRELALAARRARDFARAAVLWDEMLQNHPADGGAQSHLVLEAYEQLAILHEHRNRDPHRAAEFVRQAMAVLRKANQLGALAAAERRRLFAKWEHRRARLERKIACGQIGVIPTEASASLGESNPG